MQKGEKKEREEEGDSGIAEEVINLPLKIDRILFTVFVKNEINDLEW